MKPLRDLVLIELCDLTEIETTDSGIVLVKSGSELMNFGQEEDLMHDNVFKKKWEPDDLSSKLMQESRKNQGRIKTNDSKNIIQDERVLNILENRNKRSGIVKAVGNKCLHFKEGDRIIYKGECNAHSYIINEKKCVLISEKDILCQKVGEKIIPHPDTLLLKITKESRDNLFKKRFVREDGSEGMLFIGVDDDSLKDRKATIFVSSGIVMEVGVNVPVVKKNDLGIIHYLADNNSNIIVGYDGPDKLIIVDAVTTYHTEDIIFEADRKNKRTQAVQLKGDYDNISSLLGVVRDRELFAIPPFIFLNHASNVVAKVTRSGVLYYEHQNILEREVLAASENKYGIHKGNKVLVHDYDIFEVIIDGKKLSCVNDVDVLANQEIMAVLVNR